MVFSSPESQIGKSLIWNLNICCVKPTCPNLNRAIAVLVLRFLQQAHCKCPLMLLTFLKSRPLFVSFSFLSHTICRCSNIDFFKFSVTLIYRWMRPMLLSKSRPSLVAVSAWVLPGIPLCARFYSSLTQQFGSKFFSSYRNSNAAVVLHLDILFFLNKRDDKESAINTTLPFI